VAQSEDSAEVSEDKSALMVAVKMEGATNHVNWIAMCSGEVTKRGSSDPPCSALLLAANFLSFTMSYSICATKKPRLPDVY
jgi:hypothetical protein